MTPTATCKAWCDLNATGWSMCFDNADNPNAPFCFSSAAGSWQSSLQFDLVNPNKDRLTKSRFERFVAKLDYFFDGTIPNQRTIDSNSRVAETLVLKPTLLGWLLAESRAVAQASPSPTGSPYDTGRFGAVGTQPPCANFSPTDVNPYPLSCTACGLGTNSPCAMVNICPPSWSACNGQGVLPLFSQQFRFVKCKSTDLPGNPERCM